MPPKVKLTTAEKLSKHYKSDGAQAERDAFKEYLDRKLEKSFGLGERATLTDIKKWVSGRAKRFRSRKGGL